MMWAFSGSGIPLDTNMPERGLLNCPKCGEEVTKEEVDIGIGTMYSPPYCNFCGWSLAKEVEKKFGLKLDKSKGDS